MGILREHSVSDFYHGKTVLVTGASGSIGKVLLWKLLSSCPGIDTIYILLRPKKGETPHSRLNEILQSPIFDNFKTSNARVVETVKVIPGDLLEEKLGLSENDEELLVNSVHIIFHIAAAVKFDMDLKDAADMNIGGTQKLLELATKMPNLQAFAHTSTAYCFCDVPVLEEKVYGSQNVPQKLLMELVKSMKPETLRSCQRDLIKPHPNTYTFTKRLAENLVAEYYPKLPIAISRPTMVSPCHSEPIPGWADDMNQSVVSVCMGAAKGVLRVTLADRNSRLDIVPADKVSNSLILVAWKMGQTPHQRAKEIPVYNLGQIEREVMTFVETSEILLAAGRTYPFSVLLWYPFNFVTSNLLVFTVLTFFLQWIPAYMFDALMFALGQRRFMVRLQRRLYRGMMISSFFLLREWRFVKNNILRVRDELSEEDRKIFEVTCKNISEKDYARDVMLAGRRYLFKEDPANLPIARCRLKMLYALHCLVQLFFWLFIGWIFLRYFADPLLH